MPYVIYCQKLDSLAYIFAADSMRLSSLFASNTTEFDKMMQNYGHYVIKCQKCWYQWKAHM